MRAGFRTRGEYMVLIWWLSAVAIVLLALGAFLWRAKRKAARTMPLGRAKQRFHAQRERLEAKFIQLAAAHVGPTPPAGPIARLTTTWPMSAAARRANCRPSWP